MDFERSAQLELWITEMERSDRQKGNAVKLCTQNSGLLTRETRRGAARHTCRMQVPPSIAHPVAHLNQQSYRSTKQQEGSEEQPADCAPVVRLSGC